MIGELNEQGLKDAIQGLGDVRRSCLKMENAAEAKMSEAENALNDVRKVRGYVDIQLAEAWARLKQLQESKPKEDGR